MNVTAAKIAALCFVVWINFSSSPAETVAQVRDWNGSVNNVWALFNNWDPLGSPGVNDLVRIGNLDIAHESTVFLNVSSDIQALQIYNNSMLVIDGQTLTVSNDTDVQNGFPEPTVPGISLSGGGMLSTRDLTVHAGADVELNAGILNIDRILEITVDAELSGNGTINIDEPGGTAIRNDGLISVQGGLTLSEFNSGVSKGLIDFDGFTEDGQVDILSGGLLTIYDAEIEPFSGTMNLLSDGTLSINVPGGWVIDGQLYLWGGGGGGHSTIAGTPLTLEGRMDAQQSFFGDGEHEILANTTIAETAEVEVATDNSITFSGDTVIDGGTLMLDEDGELVFAGPTQLTGGSFQTHSDSFSDGFISFTGEATYNGIVNYQGAVRHTNDVFVGGPSTINVDHLDMDGLANTHWNINHILTINANQIDVTSNTFDSSIDLSGFFSRLNMNLDDPADHWTMDGTLELGNNIPASTATRITGSPIVLSGNTSMLNGNVRITSNTTFAGTSTLDFSGAGDDHLFLTGTTEVQSGASFSGNGSLVNDDSGSFLMANGASLGSIALVNEGQFQVGTSAAAADVDQFENSASGNWLVQIGGNAAGTEFDVLEAGDAMLDGTISVKLIDLGGGQFTPAVGDEFTILTSSGSVIGEFDNTPVSFVGSDAYEWEVLYGPNSVTLRLSNIESSVFLGDVNQDGAVNLLDVAPFIDLLTNNGYQIQADINCDGAVNLLDVAPFVDLIVGS